MTTTTIAESVAFPHAITLLPPSPLVTVEWLAGTQYSVEIGQRMTNLGGEGGELLEEVLHCITVYLHGHSGENLGAWRELFGSTHEFVPINAMTLGSVTIPNKPHLLRLWSNTRPVVRITSSDYPKLQALFCYI